MMSSISQQERNLLITAKTLLVSGLFLTIDAIFTSFDLTFHALYGILAITLLVLSVYWLFKNLENMTEKYNDEYLQYIYQNAFNHAASAVFFILVFITVFHDWLTQYFTIKYMARLCLGVGLATHGISILWRNYIDNRDIDDAIDEVKE